MTFKMIVQMSGQINANSELNYTVAAGLTWQMTAENWSMIIFYLHERTIF